MAHGFQKRKRIGQHPFTVCEKVCTPCQDKEHLKLTQIPKGCRCRIRRHNSHGAIRQRLLDLGFVPNAEVEMIRCATLGDPLEMRMGDYYVTLRKQEADLIEVLVA
jgi:ferrous iron transport protein A